MRQFSPGSLALSGLLTSEKPAASPSCTESCCRFDVIYNPCCGHKPSNLVYQLQKTPRLGRQEALKSNFASTNLFNKRDLTPSPTQFLNFWKSHLMISLFSKTCFQNVFLLSITPLPTGISNLTLEFRVWNVWNYQWKTGFSIVCADKILSFLTYLCFQTHWDWDSAIINTKPYYGFGIILLIWIKNHLTQASKKSFSVKGQHSGNGPYKNNWP